MLTKRTQPPQPSNVCYIWLSPRIYTIVDADDYEWLIKYHWRLKRSGHCFYAVRRFIRNGHIIEIKIHREIAKTPPGYDCHHRNHRTLDNRKSNLQNILPADHARYHAVKVF